MTVLQRGVRVLMLLVVLVGSMLAAPAAADTEDDLERAQERLAAAQAAADRASARYEEALASHAQLEAELLETQERIDATEASARALERTVRDIAVRAYVTSGEPPPAAVLFSGGDELLDLGRGTTLLDRASAPNLEAIEQLETVHDDLDRDRERFVEAKEASAELLVTMESESSTVQERLVAAEQTRRDLEARFQEEQLQAYYAAVQQAQELERAQATTTTRPAQRAANTPTTRAGTATTQPTTTTQKPSRPPPPAPPPRTSGDIVCPIRGSVSFVDSWGAPRSGGRTHQGVDLMSAAGTPNVAVVSGTIAQKSGSLSGNGVYLSGDDGNSYWYFHLSAYSGGPRRVAQGEVIGYTGTTGNAEGTAPHTHFEYHPGGGGAVNPYPLVRPVC
jgi:murein DD-endopeptidase MepM/ murein hydrolase activator NlpD